MFPCVSVYIRPPVRHDLFNSNNAERQHRYTAYQNGVSIPAALLGHIRFGRIVGVYAELFCLPHIVVIIAFIVSRKCIHLPVVLVFKIGLREIVEQRFGVLRIFAEQHDKELVPAVAPENRLLGEQKSTIPPGPGG